MLNLRSILCLTRPRFDYKRFELYRNYVSRRYFASPNKKHEKPKEKEVIVTTTTLAYRYVKRYVLKGSKLLIPVHIVTTMIWYFSFYVLCESDFDVVQFILNWNMEEPMLEFFKHSMYGSMALSIFLLRLVAPVRYISSVFLTLLLTKYWKHIPRLPSSEIRERKYPLLRKIASRLCIFGYLRRRYTKESLKTEIVEAETRKRSLIWWSRKKK